MPTQTPDPEDLVTPLKKLEGHHRWLQRTGAGMLIVLSVCLAPAEEPAAPPYRVVLELKKEDSSRPHRIVSAQLDFEELLSSLKIRGPFNPYSLQVEVLDGSKAGTTLPFRFEHLFNSRDKSYTTAGKLIFTVPDPQATQFAVHFGPDGKPQEAKPVPLIGDGDTLRLSGEGQSNFPVPSCYPVMLDLDGDGRRDLVGSDRYGTGAVATWFRNIGTGTEPVFSEREIHSLRTADGGIISNPNHGWFLTLTLADWDGDGVSDLLVGGWCRYLTFYKNVGANERPVYSPGKVIFDAKVFPGLDYGPNLDTPYQGVFVEACDWDGDGHLDLLCGTYLRSHLYWLRNTEKKGTDGFPVMDAPVALQANREPIDFLSLWNGRGDRGGGETDSDRVSIQTRRGGYGWRWLTRPCRAGRQRQGKWARSLDLFQEPWYGCGLEANCRRATVLLVSSLHQLRHRPEAVHEFLRVHFHLLQHGEHDVAQTRVAVFGFAAEGEPFFEAQGVVVAFREAVINVLAVFQAEPFPAGEQDGQVAVAVAVAVAHAAAEEHHRAVQQRLVAVLHRAQLVEKMRELLHDEDVAFRKALQHHGVAVVMGKIVPQLRDADLRDGEAEALAAIHVGDHARHVGAQREHDEIEHRAPVFAGLRLGHIALEARGECLVHGRLRHIEPRTEPLGALLHIAHGVEVFVELRAVVLAEFESQGLGILQHHIEYAAARVEPGALRGDTARLLAEKTVENVLRVVLRRQWRTITGIGERVPDARSDGQLQRRKPRVHPGDLRHELVARDGVHVFLRVLGIMLRAREPGAPAIVRLAERIRMMQPAEHREVFAMLCQRLERWRKLVAVPRLRDLPGHAVDAIRDINKHAAARLACSGGSARASESWHRAVAAPSWRRGRAKSDGDGEASVG